jgi:hypothetical protein
VAKPATALSVLDGSKSLGDRRFQVSHHRALAVRKISLILDQVCSNRAFEERDPSEPEFFMEKPCEFDELARKIREIL